MKKVLLCVAAVLLLSTLALADIDPSSLQACVFSRAGSPCEPGMGNDCPAFVVTVTADETLDVTGSEIWLNPGCPGTPDGDITGQLPLTAGNWIIYLGINGFPPGFPYSIDWVADGNEVVGGCADYVAGDPTTPVDCDTLFAGPELPVAISVGDNLR